MARIDQLVEITNDLNINHIQITFDGLKSSHDKKRKFKNGRGTYDIIQNNLVLLHKYVEKHRKIKVDIRVNVDKTNEDEYHTLFRYFKDKFPLFKVYPGIITQYGTCKNSIACFADQRETAEFHIRQYEKYGIIEPVFFPVMKGLSSCMAENPYTDMVGPRGELYLCLKDAGDRNEEIGSIFTGRNNWKLIANYACGNLTINDPDCQGCRVLTVCGGGCVNKKYRNIKYNEQHDCCVPFKDEDIFQKFLDIHYEQKKMRYAENS